MKKITASRMSDGNNLFPVSITIEDFGLKALIPGLWKNKETFVTYTDISGVSVDTPLIGYSTIEFNVMGLRVKAHGFTKSEVKEIKQAIDDGKRRGLATSSPISVNKTEDSAYKLNQMQNIQCTIFRSFQFKIYNKRYHNNPMVTKHLFVLSNWMDLKQQQPLSTRKSLYIQHKDSLPVEENDYNSIFSIYRFLDEEDSKGIGYGAFPLDINAFDKFIQELEFSIYYHDQSGYDFEEALNKIASFGIWAFVKYYRPKNSYGLLLVMDYDYDKLPAVQAQSEGYYKVSQEFDGVLEFIERDFSFHNIIDRSCNPKILIECFENLEVIAFELELRITNEPIRLKVYVTSY